MLYKRTFSNIANLTKLAKPQPIPLTDPRFRFSSEPDYLDVFESFVFSPIVFTKAFLSALFTDIKIKLIK